MKLIIEKSNGTTYVYRESEKVFKLVEKNKNGGRGNSKRLSTKYFDKECNTDYMKDNSHAVFNI